VEQEITAQVAHYRGLNRSVEWTVYAHDVPTDLRHRLARRGFETGEREAIMVLDTEQRPAWLGGEAGHRVEQVKTPEQLSSFQAVAEEVFGGSHHTVVQELAAALAQESEELVGYLGFDAGVGACVGRLYVSPHSCFAGLYGGGTLPGHRGRGLYRAMVAERVLGALRFGARYVRVDALPTSQPILERLGFRELTHAWPCRLRRIR
jgi:GNAT superfamily N-acetyltransferase